MRTVETGKREAERREIATRRAVTMSDLEWHGTPPTPRKQQAPRVVGVVAVATVDVVGVVVPLHRLRSPDYLKIAGSLSCSVHQ